MDKKKSGDKKRGDKDHDRGYGKLFSHPKMVEDLIRSFVKEDFVDKIDFEPQVFNSVLNKKGVSDILKALEEKLSSLKYWNEESIENALREIASFLQIKGGQIIHPTRIAISGKKVGPGLFELMVVLGRDRTLKRLEETINKIKEMKNN